jgi:hypothetical protein
VFRDPARDATIVIVSNRGTNESEDATDLFVKMARVLFPDQFPTP